ncbi:MAG: phosphoenolpyruvate carboxylase [Candidatus Xenobia bacterium]
MHTDPHAPLRRDVRLLGQLLGEILQEQEGQPLFERVEEVRNLSKRARRGDVEAAETLSGVLSRLPIEEAGRVARAFAHFLALANIAEQHHRVRRRHAYLLTGRDQRNSLEASFVRLIADGVPKEKLWQTVCGLSVEMVLTAHPTEVVRRTLLQKHRNISDLLERMERVALTPVEQEQSQQALQREITAAWLTEEIRRERPTPVDEARGGMVIFEQTIWDALPEYLRLLDRALQRHTGKALPFTCAPIRFGTWMGGDRDGNPRVTPRVTEEVCLLARWMAASLYYKEIDALRVELSMNHCSEEMRAVVGDAWEPYRHLLRGVRQRLGATRDAMAARLAGREMAADVPLYTDPRELEEPLLLCWRSLRNTHAGQVAEGRLTDILRRLACFGLTLARLDLRQEASRHVAAMDAITRFVGLGSYAQWSEEQRVTFLLRELEGRRPLIPPDMPMEPEVADVIETFRVAARQGPGSLGAYVISMASQPSNVLEVELLQREAGMKQPLRVVPLFETLNDLSRAGEVVRGLLRAPWYRQRVGERQEVMIGYSDSAREAGLLPAAWALYRAQEDIVRACRAFGVRATLFHGRGGTVGRGGGPIHHAIRSQPPGSIDGSLRVTEQGEVIQNTFGLPGIAIRTCELYTTAVVEATLMPPPAPRPDWRGLMDRLAETAYTAYRAALEDPRFVPYFRSVTPIEELGRLNIGSRPARRKKSTGLEGLRAIPWQFAWTQNRLMLPTWLGVGAALEDVRQTDEAAIVEMVREWPFLSATLDLVEMVLAKVEPKVTERYEELLVPAELREFGAAMRARYQATREEVLRVVGHDEPLQDNPVLRQSIAVRNPYVDPLNLLQAELLHRLREGEDARIVHALLITINGVASGMRNTG